MSGGRRIFVTLTLGGQREPTMAGSATGTAGGKWRGGMTTGTVKWFNAAKGYGFLTPDEGGKDVFVHHSALERAGIPYVMEGQRLSFEIQPSGKGRMAAVSLQLLD